MKLTSNKPESSEQQTGNDSNKRAGSAPREIDATAMKAFAHPLRMAMYDYLNDRGSATATMLAKHTGESTGQTSYHLRQLERHGFVTDDPSRGTGRERWWKALGFRMHGMELAKDDISTRPAISAMMRNQVAHQAASLSDWYERSHAEDPEWANLSIDSRFSVALTQDELKELGETMMNELQKYAEISRKRTDAGPEAEEGTRRIRVYLDVFPLPED